VLYIIECKILCDVHSVGRGIFLKEAKPKNSFLVEYFGELISADEGYQRESNVDDDSVFRYFIRYKKRHLWLVL